jgi:hypothetical protein
MPDAYLKCITKALKDKKGYGKERINRAKDAYNRFRESNLADGMGGDQAGADAMQKVLNALDKTIQQKRVTMMATADRLSDMTNRLDEAELIKMKVLGIGKDNPAVRAAKALQTTVESDVRMKTSASNFTSEREVAANRMFSMFRDYIDQFSRNWADVRRGSIEFTDVVRELMQPGSTGNPAAEGIAKAWRKSDQYGLSEIRRAGALIDSTGTEIPWQPVAAKIDRVSEAEFIQDMTQRIDWSKTGGGRFVLPGERADWIKTYMTAARQGTWDKVARPFEQTGGQFARDFHNERMVQFKTPEDYMFMHDKYMDGDIMQTNNHRINKLAHNIAVVKTFGPSVQSTIKAFKEMAAERARALTPHGKNAKAIKPFLDRYDTTTDMVLNQNSMDPESKLGLLVNSTSNVMTASQLGTGIFASLPGDIATTIANRLANHEPVIRTLGAIVQALAQTAKSRQEMLAMGHSSAEFLGHAASGARYGLGTEMGARWTQVIADKTMRLGLMNRGFDALKAADTRMRAISLYEQRGLGFNDVKENIILKRNGITEAEWDKTRAVMDQNPYSPAEGITMFRPVDHAGQLGEDLTNKWMKLFYNEGSRSVLATSVEARQLLRMGTRQDQLGGALLSFFSKYQGYNVTLGLAMLRSAMAADTIGGQLGSIARLGLSVVLAGALTMQMRSYWQGKKPADLTSGKFWLNAVFSSGALGLWGNFLGGATRAAPADATIKMIGGAQAQMLGDLLDTTVGSAFQAMDVSENASKWTFGKEGVKLTDFMRKYLIPQPFFIAPVLQRNILEPLEYNMDPKLMRQRFKSQKGYAKAAGTPYQPGHEPGSGVPYPFLGGG